METAITIDQEKLEEIIRIYNNETDPAATDEVISNAILLDWEDEEDHQKWLNDASAQEIADWVASFTYNEYDEEGELY